MTTPFLTAPVQSTFLSNQENIPPPPPDILVSDLTNPEALRNKRKLAVDYHENVKRLHDELFKDDVDAAFSYRVGAEVASLVPAISANVQAINLDAIRGMTKEEVAKLTKQISELSKRTSQLSFNSSARAPTDMLMAPLMLGKVEPPADAPVSLEEIELLDDERLLEALETYYELPSQGRTLESRKIALRRAYGVHT